MQRISSIRFLGYLELVFRANNMSAKQSEQNSAGWEPWTRWGIAADWISRQRSWTRLISLKKTDYVHTIPAG